MRTTLAVLQFCLLFTILAVLSVSCGEKGGRNRKDIPADIPSEVRLEIEKLYSGDPKVRGKGAKNLGEMGAKASAAVPYLVAILGDQEKYILYQDEVATWRSSPNVDAEYALRQIGDATVGPLIEALKHNDPVVREKAASALKEITGQDFGKDSTQWQAWWEGNKARHN